MSRTESLQILPIHWPIGPWHDGRRWCPPLVLGLWLINGLYVTTLCNYRGQQRKDQLPVLKKHVVFLLLLSLLLIGCPLYCLCLLSHLIWVLFLSFNCELWHLCCNCRFPLLYCLLFFFSSSVLLISWTSRTHLNSCLSRCLDLVVVVIVHVGLWRGHLDWRCVWVQSFNITFPLLKSLLNCLVSVSLRGCTWCPDCACMFRLSVRVCAHRWPHIGANITGNHDARPPSFAPECVWAHFQMVICLIRSKTHWV